MPDLSIIVPIYNERENIPELVLQVNDALNDRFTYELVLVNDGSSDGSTEELDRVAAEDKRIRVVHFRRNFGQTAAMMAGIHHATGDILVPMDGDLQNDPADIPKLIDELNKGYDVVSGWRKDRQDNPIKRNLPSRIANSLISKISGVHLNDYGCSLKAYRRDVIQDVHLYGEMHRFIPIYASWFGARVTQIPVNHRARVHGVSKYGLERVVKVILDLIVVKFLSDYSQKPIYVFGGFGLLNFAGSFLVFLLMLYYKFFGDKSFIETPLPQLATTLFAMGGFCILLGLVAEMNVRIYYETSGRKVYSVARTVNMSDPATDTSKAEPCAASPAS